jgi:hypothetical protein
LSANSLEHLERHDITPLKDVEARGISLAVEAEMNTHEHKMSGTE